MAKVTQAERVLNYIQDNGFVTRLIAFNELGIFELASRINALEKEGWVFEKTNKPAINRFGDVFHFTTYTLIDEQMEE